jgi:hypothetical protein
MDLNKEELIDKLKFISNNGVTSIYQAGIHNRQPEKISFLRSVRNTDYYQDDLSNQNHIKYTLCGKIGNQKILRSNRVLTSDNIEYVYVYEEFMENEEKKYKWFGKYLKGPLETMMHPDFAGNIRIIYRLNLYTVND